MPDLRSRTRAFIAELRRRRVIRVAVAYGAVAFAVVQVADAAFPALHFPTWTITFIVIAALLGFPIALLLSWAYDITPDPGLTAAPDAGRDQDHTARDERGAGERGAASRREEEAAGASLTPVTPFNNLPPPPTPFVGRRDELQESGRLLASPICRLLTICGTGGVGKTRLAIQAASNNLGLFRDGACFVPLSAVSAPETLISTIAQHLSLTLASSEGARSQLLNYLHAKNLLLVLDNFEQLTSSGELIAAILEQAAGVKVLVTSRERLNLHGETLFPIEGLRFPRSDARPDSGGYDAVQLFVEAARRVEPHFSPTAADERAIAQICELVEGVPLAIELAAPWVRVLTCAEILEAIRQDRDFLRSSWRDVPERHRSVRAVFESAWRLLSDQEKRVYRRLAVFRGGFGREAAEQVAGASFPLLLALLDKSLLRTAPLGRFELLEVLRQYAEEKLADDEPEAAWVRERHCEFYLGLLQGGTQREPGSARELSDELGAELENVRAAWRFAVAERKVASIARAIGGLFDFYNRRGWAQEGEEMFAAAAAALRRRAGSSEVDAAANELVLARLLVRQGVFCGDLGLNMKARELLEQSLAVFRAAGDRAETAFALDQFGMLLNRVGEFPAARRLFEESLSLSRELVDQRGIGNALAHLGTVAFFTGDYAEAERLYRQSISLFKQTGDDSAIYAPLRNLGVILSLSGATDEADRLFQESLALARAQNNQRGIVGSLQNLGYGAFLSDRYEQAELYLDEAVAICREMGFRPLLAYCLNALGNVATARQQYRRARESYHAALVTATDIEVTPLTLEILVGISRLHAEQGDAESAVELLSLVLGEPALDQDSRNSAQQLLDRLEKQLPRDEFERARERASTVDLNTMVGQVLEDLSSTAPALSS